LRKKRGSFRVETVSRSQKRRKKKNNLKTKRATILLGVKKKEGKGRIKLRGRDERLGNRKPRRGGVTASGFKKSQKEEWKKRGRNVQREGGGDALWEIHQGQEFPHSIREGTIQSSGERNGGNPCNTLLTSKIVNPVEKWQRPQISSKKTKERGKRKKYIYEVGNGGKALKI